MANESGSAPEIDIDKKLSLNDSFQFECGPHVSCFTECCGKLELPLTPYDALRLRRRLGMSGSDFIESHAIVRHRTSHGFPEVMMRMDPDRGKRCPFVTEQGCSVYEDRPAACRIYPIGRASTKRAFDDAHEEFYFVVREAHCRGFEQTKRWTIREWIGDQGLEEYNRLNDLLMELYVKRRRSANIQLTAQHMQMFVMALYNPEKFRMFIFESPFLAKFDLDDELVQSIKEDDVRLLEFAFVWLRFALFREQVIKVRKG